MVSEHLLNEQVDLEVVEDLLNDVFGERLRALHAAPFSRRYLEWLYRDNPCGQEVAANLMHGDVCRAHYAIVPQRWRDGTRTLPMSLSLNSAVSEASRGKGAFTRTAKATYERARTTRGIVGVLGVGNANSTHGLVKSLGFRFVAPLPVRVGVAAPVRLRGVSRAGADDLPEAFFASRAGGWEQAWDRETLRWRLASPRASYLLHHDRRGAIVSCRTLHRGVPVAVILKVLSAPGRPPAMRRLLAAAARGHRTAFYLYAGWNGDAHVPGVPIPRRLLPAPLNLTYLPLDSTAPDPLVPRTFELLDFDAY
ncbi:MAG: GNAT family N-acetyltransferase [Sandaracinaceae bacterium]|nr:GNAT family N-acetyltransferase [Sandaracinaceae bacterium]MBX3276258.1 GNAT family N-acetyltransferase [Sandaracinaceae bacterium]